jgi:hypothetical protein
MAIKFSNNASAPLASGINNSVVALSVTTGQGNLFPTLSGSDYFYATLVDSSNNIEVIKVTARSGDSMTIVRAQDGTTARSYAAGDKIEVRVTAAGLAAIQQEAIDGSTSTLGSALAFSIAL